MAEKKQWVINPGAEAIGVTSGAFSVGKRALVAWCNGFLAVELEKVEEISTGWAACQLMDACFPGAIQLAQVNFAAKTEYDSSRNFKVLQGCLNRVGVTKNLDVVKLIKGKYQDNLEFFQWIKAFVDKQFDYDCDPAYDPVARRKAAMAARKKMGPASGKRPGSAKMLVKPSAGAAPRTAAKGAAAGGSRSRQTSTTSAGTPTNPARRSSGSMPRKTTTAPASGGGAALQAAKKENAAAKAEAAEATKAAAAATAAAQTTAAMANAKADELAEQNTVLQQQIIEVMDAYEQVKNTGETLESERDFYYTKLLAVENIAVMAAEKSDAGVALAVIQSIVSVLHAEGDADAIVDEATNIINGGGGGGGGDESF